MSNPTLHTLRQYAVTRSLFAPTALSDAVQRLGFVQIDPITAPACAQDLILRHRVKDYQNGDMARTYPDLAVEEAFFINHGYMARSTAALLWSNKPHSAYVSEHAAQVAQVLQFAQEHDEVHPKLLNQHIGHKVVANNWGGTGLQATQTVQRMHSSGMLRIVRRDKGARVYGLPVAQVDAPLDEIVQHTVELLAQTYAPFTRQSMIYMCRLLASSRPDAKAQIKHTLSRLDELFAHAQVDGVRWYWPHGEELSAHSDEQVRLLTPFDPVVWDRARFEAFWGWTYKFEAYKPAHARQLGYYALPLFWRDDCIGWGNASVINGQLQVELAYVQGAAPTDKRYKKELQAELARLAQFLNCSVRN